MKDSYADKELLLTVSNLPLAEVYIKLKTSADGLTMAKARERLQKYGKNIIAREKPPTWYSLIFANFKNPFVIVLLVLGAVSYLTGDMRATIVVIVMVLLSVIMRFLQEFRSSRAAEALRAMILVKATVRRQMIINENDQVSCQDNKCEIPFEDLVPGDIFLLSAGDMLPADVRLINSKDLFISQSALTGESMPVEKYDTLAGD